MTASEAGLLATGALAVVLGLSLRSPRRVAEVLTIAGAFTITWNSLRVPGSLTVSDAFLFAALVVVLTSTLRHRLGRSPIAPTQRRLLLIAALLLVGGLLGGVASGAADVGFDTGLRFGVSVLAITLLVTVLVATFADWMRFAWWYVVGAGVSGLVAVTGGEMLVGRPLGLANHPNHLAHTMMLALFLAIALLRLPWAKRVCVVLTLPVLLSALLLSGSRGALAALAGGLVALLLMRRARSIPALVAMAVLCAVVVIALPDVLGGESAIRRSFAPTEFDVESSAARVAYYEEALDLIADSPVLGHGFSQALTFHNVPLQFVVTGGVLGFVALLLLFQVAWRSVRYASARGRPLVVQASAAGIVASGLFLMVANSFYDRYLLFVFSLEVAACSGRLALADRPAPERAGVTPVVA